MLGSLLPLVALPLLFVTGFGPYRAFRYGVNARRYWGLLPIALILFGGIVGPFIYGFLRGAGAAGSGTGLLTPLVFAPLSLAVVTGAVLMAAFRPARR